MFVQPCAGHSLQKGQHAAQQEEEDDPQKAVEQVAAGGDPAGEEIPGGGAEGGSLHGAGQFSGLVHRDKDAAGALGDVLHESFVYLAQADGADADPGVHIVVQEIIHRVEKADIAGIAVGEKDHLGGRAPFRIALLQVVQHGLQSKTHIGHAAHGGKGIVGAGGDGGHIPHPLGIVREGIDCIGEVCRHIGQHFVDRAVPQQIGVAVRHGARLIQHKDVGAGRGSGGGLIFIDGLKDHGQQDGHHQGDGKTGRDHTRAGEKEKFLVEAVHQLAGDEDGAAHQQGENQKHQPDEERTPHPVGQCAV